MVVVCSFLALLVMPLSSLLICLSSTSPSLISSISFTVQSSINGYTILCEDGGGDYENCTIYIAGTIYTATSTYFTMLLGTVNYRALYISTQLK